MRLPQTSPNVAARRRGQRRPNILWIIGDDLCPDLGCYGTPLVRTPNIDRLAGEGVRYTNAFTTAPVCSPSRSALITGMYQTSIGAHHHRSNRERPLPPSIRLITDYFRQAGYFCCNGNGLSDSRPGKTDFNFKMPDRVFDGTDWSQREQGQPFFAQVQLFEPHRPFQRDPEHPIDPDAVKIPDCYPDHPLARQDWALYLESIQILDRKVGQALRRIDEEGLTENTVVFFFGDNGRPHVRDKQFLYDGGVRVPLLIRWPGELAAGTVCDDLVSAVDFGPTCMSLVGIVPPDYMEGQLFLGTEAETRDHIFAARDRCDETEDRIRSVYDGRHRYIRNFHPQRPYSQPNAYKKVEYPVWTLMELLHSQGALAPGPACFMAAARPEEELYDLRDDPNEVHNLADDAQHRPVLEKLRGALEQWIDETGDLGATPEAPEEVARWRAAGRDYLERGMERHGLSPDITPEEHLAYWERALTPTHTQGGGSG